MEKYFRYTRCKHHNDVEIYENVVMIMDMTPRGPKKGQKFVRVDFYTIMNVVVFDENSKKSFVLIGLDKDNKPFFLA